MPHASTWEARSPGRVQGVERAKRAPEGRFHARAPLIDVPALPRASRRRRWEAAGGGDGVTKEPYGQDLEAPLQDVHVRLKAKRYRHQPIRRVHIPKGQGKTRPMGIAAFEDTVVHDAVREVLEALYAQDFLDSADGFRPGRRAHDAWRTLDQSVPRGEVRWVLEADMGSFFDRVDRTERKKRREMRVADGSLMRRMGKCVHVGVLDGEAWSEPERGTTPGSVRSPLLGNVSLHDGLARWCATAVKPRLRGQATLIRSCEDGMIGCEREDEARRVLTALGKRLGRFGLTLPPDKTRRLPCGCPRVGQHGGRGPAPFDLVGCTCSGARARKGHWGMGCTTRRASLRRAKQAIDDGCRRPRHPSVQAHHAAR
jgi:RNA-directed DNA polymerase